MTMNPADFVDFGGGAAPPMASTPAPAPAAFVPAASPPVAQPAVSQPAPLATSNAVATPPAPTGRSFKRGHLNCEDAGGSCTIPTKAPVATTPVVSQPAPAQAPQMTAPTVTPQTNFMAAAATVTPAPATTTQAPAQAPQPAPTQTYVHSATGAQVVGSPLPPDDMDGEIVTDMSAFCVDPTEITGTTAAAAQPAPGDKDLDESQALWNDIQSEIGRVSVVTGICVLFNADPASLDCRNTVHVAIFNMRHNPMVLTNMATRDLCVYEAALAANQVTVRALENEWSMKAVHLGRERDSLLRKKRGRYKGDTEKGKEDAVLDNEPGMKQLHREFAKAHAVSTYLRDMGASFAQLEDGIKRLIDNRREEERRGSGRQNA